MKVSIVMASFRRAKLLDLGINSIIKQKIKIPTKFEIIVINDGIEDDTKKVCNKYNKLGFDIKYIFSGQRNNNKIISRVPGYALNIGVQQSKYEIIILTCPEIYHINNSVDNLLKPLLNNDLLITIPKIMGFDDNNNLTNFLLKQTNTRIPDNILKECFKNLECEQAVQMPFFMALYKKHFIDIGGYDEDFTGYAGDDNDLVYRLNSYGLSYFKINAKIIHLYHGKRCDSTMHLDNPEWKYNWSLFQKRKNNIRRNIYKDWGKIL